MTAKESNRTIHFVPGLRFSCTGCGKCCHNDWDLPVTKTKAESIGQTDLFKQKVREGYLPLQLVSDDLYILGSRPDGGCVFLDGELCEIHRDIGPDAKPLTCQLFPLNLVRAPDGYHVSLSFACPAVLAGVGPPIEERRSWLTGFVATDDDIPPLTRVIDDVSLSANLDISYADYLRLESELLGCLDDSLCPQGLVNWACTLLEGGLAQFSPMKVSDLLPEALDLLDVFSRTIVGIIELEVSPDEREAYIQALATDFAGRSNKLDVSLPVFSYYRPPSEMCRTSMVRFLRSQFAGKRLLTGSSVVSRLLAFATGLAILCYYVEAQARETGSLHFSFQQLERAFALVEENILTHSDDLDPFFDSYENALLRMMAAYESEKEHLQLS